ncbi:hypothetical protein D3OALGB2SA_4000 [Olavius algarvensis associated proteobacterium Delta 3]|nr:hypothetical protein D3OALGB2SA_4000 [Olavius algarvensis associated proteobacterium Delta 3]
MLKRSGTINRFELESLEPRILLSADVAAATPCDLQDDCEFNLGDDLLPQADEVALGDDICVEEKAFQDEHSYDPSQSIDDIFAGLTGKALIGGDDVADEADPFEDVPDAVPADSDRFAATEPQPIDRSEDGCSGVVEILDTRLVKPVYDYFNDAVDPPDSRGIPHAIKKCLVYNDDDVDITVDCLDGGLSPCGGALQSDLERMTTRNGDICASDPGVGGGVIFESIQVDKVFDPTSLDRSVIPNSIILPSATVCKTAFETPDASELILNGNDPQVAGMVSSSGLPRSFPAAATFPETLSTVGS